MRDRRRGASRSDTGELSCNFIIAGKSNRVTVQLIGKCKVDEILNSASQHLHPDDQAPSAPGCDKEDEIAILQPSVKLAPARCLPLSFDDPKIGEQLGTLGYPSKTNRDLSDGAPPKIGSYSQGNTPGQVLTWSSGQRVERSTCSSTYSEDGVKTTFDTTIEGSDMMNSRFIQTTIDIVPGSSGGPLINSKGEVVGVASNIKAYQLNGKYRYDLQTNENECRGASFFSPMRNLKTMIQARKPALLGQLTCTKFRATRAPTIAM